TARISRAGTMRYRIRTERSSVPAPAQLSGAIHACHVHERPRGPTRRRARLPVGPVARAKCRGVDLHGVGPVEWAAGGDQDLPPRRRADSPAARTTAAGECRTVASV